ncbi:hypothetical protein [Nonomuraea sp. NPDC023979]|uniref:hypothetical protein n=1 Tax=Nonomuraea sp. NPDC023979 TaxID=3154796 RepID=UPI0033F10AE9
MTASQHECTAEEVDGYLDPGTCEGCEGCVGAVYDQIEHGVEMGNLTEEEAHDQQVRFGQFGILP